VKIDVARETGAARLRLEGRLDREGSEQLSYTFDTLLQAGIRTVTLDLAGVTYVSTAGTRVLKRWREELAVLRGKLHLSELPAAVEEFLADAGWGPASETSGPGRSSAADHRRSTWYSAADLASSGHYEMSSCAPAGTLVCRLHGNPGRLTEAPFREEDCNVVPLPVGTFGIGLGAIGSSYEGCAGRIGELLAVDGHVAYFPSDGARMADYVVGSERVTPRAVLASGLTCEGGFAKLLRFSTQPESQSVPLSELATTGLNAVGGGLAGMVIAGETAGLAGARLRRSPAGGATGVQFEVPDVRDWLSFAPQRTYPMATALIAGVVARSPKGPLAGWLRPLEGTEGLFGHFHAAVFSYHALPQRTVELGSLVAALFENHQLRDVLHLVSDNRGAAGVAESALLRGVGWVAPITDVVEARP
jgi:anti-anti-sigma factor